MNKPVEIIEVPGVETVDLIVRNINGEGVLFTSDGKMIGQQIAHVGHYFYVGEKEDRTCTYRASFVVDKMKFDAP